MKTVKYVEEFTIPQSAIFEVARFITGHDLANAITDTDEDDETITIEIGYSKDDRALIHELKDLIADQEDKSEEEDED